MRRDVALTTIAVLILLTTCLPWVLFSRVPSVENLFNKQLYSTSTSGAQKELNLETDAPPVKSQQGVFTEELNNPIPKQPSLDAEASNNTFHFVVSSGCRRYQWWQVLTQIHSARAVGQRGKYTWIVSGCKEENVTQDELLQVFESHFSPVSPEGFITETNVHFTPDYSNMSAYGGPYADGKKRRTFLNRKGEVQRGTYGNKYHFNNKPNGLRHWAEEHFSDTVTPTDEAIVLIDPDFLFLAPFHLSMEVAPGKPASASYGLGSQWLDFNLTAICGEDTPCTRTTSEQVHRHYSAGPPYIIHAHDVLKLATLWSKYVPPTYDQYPLLYAEMFAYSMAAVNLNLPHKLFPTLYTGCMVGWPGPKRSAPAGPSAKAFLLQARADTKVPIWDGPASCYVPPLVPPPFLHYCARYAFHAPPSFGEPEGSMYFVAKRKVPHDILECNSSTPFLSPFPTNEKERIQGGNEDWTTLVVCSIVRAVNYARKSYCGETS